jgi:osmotically-inducible protein OsmY
MKTKILFASVLAGTFLCNRVFAQSSGSASGAVHVAPVVPRTGITPVTRPNGVVQPGTTIQNKLNGQPNPAQNANPQFTATASNGFAGTNTIAGTNGLMGTNNFAGTNGLAGTNNVTAMVSPTTNFNININSNFNGNVVMQDQAVTPTDRVLLTTLSQGVRATLGITPNGNTPVHFLIQNGTVTVVGTVESTAQSQAVLSQIQQTPGVLTVVNDMHVRGAFAPAVQNGGGGSLLGVPTDRAFSASDQTLLTTVQQEAALQLGVTALGQMPVHFSIENGVVGVTGHVNSQQEKQALIAAIGRTRGIVRVVDNVSVTASSTTGLPGNVGPSANTVNGALTPTSRGTNQLISTNSSGF